MIWLVRHGLDDEKRVGGWSDVPLVEEGIKQAEDLKEFVNMKLTFNKVVSSDIKRSMQTAQIINTTNKPIIFTNLLREQNKGIYNGVLRSELSDDEMIFKELSIYDKFPDGESIMDLYFRIEKLLLIMDEWDNDLVITHRGVINMIYYLLQNKRPDMYKDSFNVTHASVHKLDLKNKTIERIK